jgi:hypothetical protein
MAQPMLSDGEGDLWLLDEGLIDENGGLVAGPLQNCAGKCRTFATSTVAKYKLKMFISLNADPRWKSYVLASRHR